MPKLLVIEDNEANLDMLCRRLLRRGFDVLSAANAYDGIATARREIPDLILMDVNLPEMDGLEATRQIKAEKRTRQIPVIALTAHATPGDREAALHAGCDDYDPKPVKFQRLLNKIGRLIAVDGKTDE